MTGLTELVTVLSAYNVYTEKDIDLVKVGISFYKFDKMLSVLAGKRDHVGRMQFYCDPSTLAIHANSILDQARRPGPK